MNYSVLSTAEVPRQECILRTVCILSGICMIIMSVLLFILYESSGLLDNLLRFYYM